MGPTMGHAMGGVMCDGSYNGWGHMGGGVMCSWVTHLIMWPPILGRVPYVQSSLSGKVSVAGGGNVLHRKESTEKAKR